MTDRAALERTRPATTQPGRVRRRADGAQTHAAILATATRLASVEGLSRLTIGRLAAALGVSKSGVYAHFRSKERLQYETVEAAAAVFVREVMEPGLAAPEGLARLERTCEAFLSYVERGVFPGGCFFAQVIAEFDAQAGVLREQITGHQQAWSELLERLVRTARDRGELAADTDPAQLAFELSAMLEAANYRWVLSGTRAALDRGRQAVRTALSRAAAGTACKSHACQPQQS